MSVKLSISDKLLVAALEIEDSGKEQFSAEDLVVSAWKKFPDAFGLQGYLDNGGKAIYPNSNRVYAEIMGSKPLRKQGLLQKVGSKMYRLTEAGRVRAKSLVGFSTKPSPEKWSLAREKVEQMRRLFESKTAQKVRAGNVEEISFFDACGFWGISPRSGAKNLWSRFAHIEAILDEAQKSLGSRNEVSSRHGAPPYTANDIESLRHIHKILQEKFEKEIGLIKDRIDDRKI
jgi:hypothetical protein